MLIGWHQANLNQPLVNGGIEVIEIELVATAILVVGFVDDLRSRKIHNKLLLGLLLFTVVFAFFVRGLHGLSEGVISAGLALLLTFPLVFFRALGGGDMKLFTLFGFLLPLGQVVQVFALSILAGAAIGLVRAALGGQLMAVIRSTAAIAVHKGVKPTGEHNIPYSAALLLGWLMNLSMIHFGGGLL